MRDLKFLNGQVFWIFNMIMNKSTLKTIVDKYKEAEHQVDQLDELGVCIWNPKKENFYNKYNYIIFELLNEVYGPEKGSLVEDYILDQTTLTFDEFYDYLENH